MTHVLLSAALLAVTCSASAAASGDLTPKTGIVSLYAYPDRTIDFLTAVDTVSESEVDNLYALDLDGFTLTLREEDDQSDPLPLRRTLDAN